MACLCVWRRNGQTIWCVYVLSPILWFVCLTRVIIDSLICLCVWRRKGQASRGVYMWSPILWFVCVWRRNGQASRSVYMWSPILWFVYVSRMWSPILWFVCVSRRSGQASRGVQGVWWPGVRQALWGGQLRRVSGILQTFHSQETGAGVPVQRQQYLHRRRQPPQPVSGLPLPQMYGHEDESQRWVREFNINPYGESLSTVLVSTVSL